MYIHAAAQQTASRFKFMFRSFCSNPSFQQDCSLFFHLYAGFRCFPFQATQNKTQFSNVLPVLRKPIYQWNLPYFCCSCVHSMNEGFIHIRMTIISSSNFVTSVPCFLFKFQCYSSHSEMTLFVSNIVALFLLAHQHVFWFSLCTSRAKLIHKYGIMNFLLA